MSGQASDAKAAASDALTSLQEKAIEAKQAIQDRVPTITTSGGDGPADTELYDTLGALPSPFVLTIRLCLQPCACRIHAHSTLFKC